LLRRNPPPPPQRLGRLRPRLRGRGQSRRRRRVPGADPDLGRRSSPVLPEAVGGRLLAGGAQPQRLRLAELSHAGGIRSGDSGSAATGEAIEQPGSIHNPVRQMPLTLALSPEYRGEGTGSEPPSPP